MVQEKLRGITLQRLCSIGRLLHSTYDAAQNLLGFMHRQGSAVARNHAKTMRWLKLASLSRILSL